MKTTTSPCCSCLNLDQIALVLCDAASDSERALAHAESRREAERMLLPALTGGFTIRRFLYSAPALQGAVCESYDIRCETCSAGRLETSLLAMRAADLRYFSFVPSSENEMRIRECLAGVSSASRLFRAVSFTLAGKGISRVALPPPAGGSLAEEPSRRQAALLPAGRIRDDESERLYIAPYLRALQMRQFDPCAPDRWRATHELLVEIGRSRPAAIIVTAQAVRLDERTKAYLNRSARLLAGTAGMDDGAGLAAPVLDILTSEPAAVRVEIEVTNADLVHGFVADTDPKGFVDCPPHESYPNLFEATGDGYGDEDEGRGEELKILISPLGSLYTLDEACSLLTPSISFLDALPGCLHYIPHQLRRAGSTSRAALTAKNAQDAPERQRGAHYDRAGDFPIGTTGRDGAQKIMNSERFRTGTVLAGPPGTGKTTGAKTLVRRLRQVRPDVIINLFDPVGYEWLDIAREAGGMIIRFEPGSPPPITFNPFFAPANITLTDHSSTLARLLSSVFPGNKIAKAYLEAMVVAAYISYWKRQTGQDLDLSRATGATQRQRPDACPNFPDFLDFAPRWLEQQADSRVSRQQAENVEYFKLRRELVRHSMVTAILSGKRSLYEQLDGSFLLSLQTISNPDVRQSVLAIFLGLFLSEINGDSRSVDTERLQRLIVLEEAHEVIGRESRQSQGDELAEGASEVIAQQIIHVLRTKRKLGIGTLILDQSFSSLDPEVLKNCSNILAMRTPFPADQEMLGRLMGISDREARDLATLETGECIVRLEGDTIPVRVMMDVV